MVETAMEVHGRLKERGISSSVANARFAAPLDRGLLKELAAGHRLLVVMEENVASGGFGEHVAAALEDMNLPIPLLRAAIPDTFGEHGSVSVLRKKLGLDSDSITGKILKRIG